MPLREKLEWFGRMAVLAFILGSVAFLSAIMTIRFAIQGRDVAIPEVVGKKAGDAQTELARRGLGMRIADKIYSDAPADQVIRQSPPAGTKVKAGQRAHLVISLGPRKMPIPALEGKSLRAARLDLLRTGLQLGEVSSAHLPAREPDLILKQSPPPGQLGAGSPRVNLLVALPPPEEAYVMPDVIGLPVEEARRRLGAAGLSVSSVTVAAPGEFSSGTVVQQRPRRGSRVVAGSRVELQVLE